MLQVKNGSISWTSAPPRLEVPRSPEQCPLRVDGWTPKGNTCCFPDISRYSGSVDVCWIVYLVSFCLNAGDLPVETGEIWGQRLSFTRLCRILEGLLAHFFRWSKSELIASRSASLLLESISCGKCLLSYYYHNLPHNGQYSVLKVVHYYIAMHVYRLCTWTYVDCPFFTKHSHNINCAYYAWLLRDNECKEHHFSKHSAALRPPPKQKKWSLAPGQKQRLAPKAGSGSGDPGIAIGRTFPWCMMIIGIYRYNPLYTYNIL
jgi:hypothetical protein